MRTATITKAAMAVAIIFAGAAIAHAGFSLSVGTDNFYLSVGNYDYYPYAVAQNPYSHYSRISFYDVLDDYGYWVNVAPFGRTWRPYAAPGWRPYVYGRWVSTAYGPYWMGYEPWAWVGYHYGNWIFTQRFGWVWVPGYEWHSGRVIWSQGYGTIGWMPAPPWGYDYSYGYLSYRGDYNQFAYYDQDFGFSFDYYGGYNNDYRYRDLYYTPGYRNIVSNLWVFVQINNIGYQSYADCYLDGSYARNVFDRRQVRISSQPLQRTSMDRIFKQKVPEVRVQEREIETTERRVRMVVPVGQEDTIRKNANRVVEEVIAPGFVENRRTFKGLESRNTKEVNQLFRQERSTPKVKQVEAEEVVRRARQVEEKQKDSRVKITRQRTEVDAKAEKEFQSRGNSGNARTKGQKPVPKVETPSRNNNQSREIERSSRYTLESQRNNDNRGSSRDSQFDRGRDVSRSEQPAVRNVPSRSQENDRGRFERGSADRPDNSNRDQDVFTRSTSRSEDVRSDDRRNDSRSSRVQAEDINSGRSEKESVESRASDDKGKDSRNGQKNEKQNGKEKSNNGKSGKDSNKKNNKPNKKD